MTFNDLATDAYIKNGILAPGETLDANLAAYAMREANRLLDQWNIQDLFVWTTVILSFNLTARTLPTYWFTIGPSGGNVVPDFVAAQPPWIIRANLLLTSSSPNARVPLELLDDRQWSDETIPALGTTIPNKLYYDYSNTPNGVDANNNALGLSNLYISPYPTVTQNKIELFVPNQVSRFTDINNTFSMPAGYEDAFMLTLSERVIEGIKDIPATLAQAAARARANVRSTNSRSPKISTTDSGMPGNRKQGQGNFYNGWPSNLA